MSIIKTMISVNAIALAFVGGGAQAATTAYSSSYGVKADVRVLNGAVAALASVGAASGSAAPAYNEKVVVASVDQSAKLVNTFSLDAYQSLKTGIITNIASSNYPTALGASASSIVDGLDVAFTTSLFDALPLASLGVGSRTITSTTSVGVNANGLYSTGSSMLEGLAITGSLLGLFNIDGGLYVNAAANTEIKLAGLSIILNEQKETRSGTGDIFRYTNAINIGLTDYLLAGRVLTGNIVIGHSEAGISGYVAPVVGAVPEPATWGMMILGFGMIGAAARRSKRALAAA